MATLTENAVQRAFEARSQRFADNEALSRALTLVQSSGFDLEEFANQYDTVALTHDWSSDVTIARLKKVAESLQREASKENRVQGRKSAVGFKGMPTIGAKTTWEDLPDKLHYTTPSVKRQATESSVNSLNSAPSNLLRTSALGKGAAGLTPTSGLGPATGSRVGIQAASVITTPPPYPSSGLGMMSTASKFTDRQNRGQAACPVLNEHLPTLTAQHSSSGNGSGSGVGVELLSHGAPLDGVKHLFMSEPLETKIHALDERIEDFGMAVAAALPEAADIMTQSVADITQEPVWVVGRVVCEAEEGAAAQLNEASLLLEGCRETSAGARIKLDTSRLHALRLFPGQSVAVKGMNPSGRAFVAERIITHLPAQRCQQQQQQRQTTACLPEQQSSSAAAGPGMALRSSGLSMVVAAGPFAASDSLGYEPLRELLAYCSGAVPDVLVLLGPFVDVEHPMVASGDMPCTHDELWRGEVAARIAAWRTAYPSTSVVLVPSVRDVTALPVFPQPPLTAEGLGGSEGGKLLLLQNPCTATAGPLVFGTVTADVLRALSSAELSRSSGPAGDRLAALASHVMGQRSYYPLYPPQPGACLDTTHYSQLVLPTTPDILLMPSDLAPFAKAVPLQQYELSVSPSQAEGQHDAAGAVKPVPPVAVVNPGRLARGTSGGTFAQVSISAGNEPLHARTKVEIRRI